MINEGIVLKIEGDFAVVGVKRQSACDTCRAKCGGHCDKATTVETVVKNTLHAKVGDRVTLYSKTATVMGFAMTVFVLPIITAFLGFLLPYLLNFSNGVCAAFSALSFILTYFFIWLIYRNKKHILKNVNHQSRII